MTTASPQTLFDIAGIQARILTLPDRPPFMTAGDLAEVYQTETRWLNRAVRRNPKRFPEDFCFRLTEAETARLKLQNVTSPKANRALPMAFTQAGAYALSGVLTSDVAIEVGIAIYRAFTAMELAALADTRDMVARLQVDALRKKPIYGFVAMAMEKGLGIEAMRRMSSYPQWKLEQAARDMLAMRLIGRLPEGMPPGLFDHV